MQVDQALRALSQLKSAAPPTASARLSEVIDLLQQLEDENVILSQQVNAPSAPPPPDFAPQGFELLKPSMQLVRSQAEALRTGKVGRITTEQADCLKLIYEHTSTAIRLIDTLGDLDLMREGNLPIDPMVFSGLDLLAQTWQKHFEAAEEREHHLNIHADDPLPPVEGDYRLIASILSDLVDNAIHYTPFGGMIRITAETLGTQVLFSVADNGIGMSSEDLEYVGQPYWRALHQPLVRQHPGTGLRLFRARLILNLHESDLFYSGDPGMGSTFSFALPVG